MRRLSTDLEPSYERLRELLTLESDWDGNGAHRPTRLAVLSAAELIAAVWDTVRSVHAAKSQPYEIMPIADGGLQVEWRGTSERVDLNVGPDGSTSFLHVAGHGDGRTYREGDDLPFVEAIRLVKQVVGN